MNLVGELEAIFTEQVLTTGFNWAQTQLLITIKFILLMNLSVCILQSPFPPMALS